MPHTRVRIKRLKCGQARPTLGCLRSDTAPITEAIRLVLTHTAFVTALSTHTVFIAGSFAMLLTLSGSSAKRMLPKALLEVLLFELLFAVMILIVIDLHVSLTTTHELIWPSWSLLLLFHGLVFHLSQSLSSTLLLPLRLGLVLSYSLQSSGSFLDLVISNYPLI